MDITWIWLGYRGGGDSLIGKKSDHYLLLQLKLVYPTERYMMHDSDSRLRIDSGAIPLLAGIAIRNTIRAIPF